MLTAVNRFGLSRNIPSEVKRKVRQKCGFGCVVCGVGIYEYEHVDPSFSEAKTHDPENITLLCSQCHARVTRGIWSKSKIKMHMADPKCKITGYSFDYFDFDIEHPYIEIGGVRLEQCSIPIMIKDTPLFQIKPPEENGTPFLLSATFYDSSGRNSLTINDNEWYATDSNWDVEVNGKTITIREGHREVHLKIVAVPPKGIIIERINMHHRDISITGGKNDLSLQIGARGAMNLTGNLISNCYIGICIG